ncbi:MAG: hypothetical protein KJZ80_05840 [Hyphomicrobiaceae bacterium]|nr:hypothetical protein [Hyphomicrobiaceae bacterium]
MGIDRLTKAANAAGYAMANSEDLLEPSPAPGKGESRGWRVADPARHSQERAAAEASGPVTGFRDWWLSLSSKATA